MNNFFDMNIMKAFLAEPSIRNRPINLYIGERPKRYEHEEPMVIGETHTNNANHTEQSVVDELQSALQRQIAETNRINNLYCEAIKKISYLEHENNAYKNQLEEYYKIKELLQKVGVQITPPNSEE